MDEYDYSMEEVRPCLQHQREKRLQRMVHVLIVVVLTQFAAGVILLVVLGLHGQEPRHNQVRFYIYFLFISFFVLPLGPIDRRQGQKERENDMQQWAHGDSNPYSSSKLTAPLELKRASKRHV